MQVQLDYNIEAYTIRSYDPGLIKISLPLSESLANTPAAGEDLLEERQLEIRLVTSACCVFPSRLIENWAVSGPAELTIADFSPIVALEPEIIVLGTGDHQIFPDSRVISQLNRQRIGVEVMNTPAACRTYNFLMSDGRKVAAALFMLDNKPA